MPKFVFCIGMYKQDSTQIRLDLAADQVPFCQASLSSCSRTHMAVSAMALLVVVVVGALDLVADDVPAEVGTEPTERVETFSIRTAVSLCNGYRGASYTASTHLLPIISPILKSPYASRA